MTSTSQKPTIEADSSAKELVVAHRFDAAAGVVTLELADSDGAILPAWQPGAHIDLMLENGVVRQYSLCGTPENSSTWRIGILRDPASRGGSAYVHDNIGAGSTVRVRGPRNHFPLEDSPSYIFVAGGIGITPILPMVAEADRRGRDWRLLYLGRSASTMAFTDELSTTYGDRVRLWHDDVHGICDLGSELAVPVADTLIYSCGPEPLLSALEQHSIHWPAGSLHVERFAAKPAAEPSQNSLATFQVECRRSAVTVEVSEDTSILEALEDADVPIMSSCLEGICGTCEAPVLEGAPDHRDSMLSAEQHAAGNTILTCVSRSLSQTLVLDI
ncbi:PDR/VanB family oxidoreductase [Mycolicibacterium sp. P9-22]|uniref:PDR/VanB family oxidoreductase n=1 Tax=Mycolicibacterium sp. P9-22 TaxID=2024613 RepID=UPI0011F00CDC|nr:PDR/VanB family oxidoreductase [Mycolicibacterium sp. P9-22]KAA0120548.1 oxidoreductase [Mycolicibacterium sp. P9-22]